MALEPCRECGHEVSTEAETCPQCGVPNPTRDEDEHEFSEWYHPPEDQKSSSSRPSGEVVLENPENGYRKTFRHAGIKTFLTGSL